MPFGHHVPCGPRTRVCPAVELLLRRRQTRLHNLCVLFSSSVARMQLSVRAFHNLPRITTSVLVPSSITRLLNPIAIACPCCSCGARRPQLHSPGEVRIRARNAACNCALLSSPKCAFSTAAALAGGRYSSPKLSLHNDLGTLWGHPKTYCCGVKLLRLYCSVHTKTQLHTSWRCSSGD